MHLIARQNKISTRVGQIQSTNKEQSGNISVSQCRVIKLFKVKASLALIQGRVMSVDESQFINSLRLKIVHLPRFSKEM